MPAHLSKKRRKSFQSFSLTWRYICVFCTILFFSVFSFVGHNGEGGGVSKANFMSIRERTLINRIIHVQIWLSLPFVKITLQTTGEWGGGVSKANLISIRKLINRIRQVQIWLSLPLGRLTLSTTGGGGGSGSQIWTCFLWTGTPPHNATSSLQALPHKQKSSLATHFLLSFGLPIAFSHREDTWNLCLFLAKFSLLFWTIIINNHYFCCRSLKPYTECMKQSACLL